MALTDIVWSPNHEDKFCVIFKNIIFLLKISDYDGIIPESGRKCTFVVVSMFSILAKVIGGKYKFKLTLLNTITDFDNLQVLYIVNF